MFTVRDATANDMSLVYSAWSHGYLDAPAVRGFARDAYFPWMFEKITQILVRPTTRTRVACAESDHDVILGFAVFEETKGALHWAYVRGGEDSARGIGIARACVGDWPVSCYTFRSRMLRRAPDGWAFRPDLGAF